MGIWFYMWMYDGYMGVFVDVCWIYGGICGCLMGIWGYMWMYDRYMGIYLDV